MNANISLFVTSVEGIIYFLLYNLHDRTFKPQIPKILDQCHF